MGNKRQSESNYAFSTIDFLRLLLLLLLDVPLSEFFLSLSVCLPVSVLHNFLPRELHPHREGRPFLLLLLPCNDNVVISDLIMSWRVVFKLHRICPRLHFLFFFCSSCGAGAPSPSPSISPLIVSGWKIDFPRSNYLMTRDIIALNRHDLGTRFAELKSIAEAELMDTGCGGAHIVPFN